MATPFDRVLDRNNATKIPKITSPERFKCFADEVAPLLGETKFDKCMKNMSSLSFRLMICLPSGLQDWLQVAPPCSCYRIIEAC